MPEYADLLFEVDSNVATITLNRPDRLNAISGPMLESLSQALRDADRDRDVRVIVITASSTCARLPTMTRSTFSTIRWATERASKWGGSPVLS